MTINVPANSTVRYTLDSTDPNESSPVYAGPIEVETNTVIRARAYRDGVEASQIISETYLISVYHTMPVICLTTDPDNLTNEEYGAFAYGPNVDPETDDRPWFKKPRSARRTGSAAGWNTLTKTDSFKSRRASASA